MNQDVWNEVVEAREKAEREKCDSDPQYASKILLFEAEMAPVLEDMASRGFPTHTIHFLCGYKDRSPADRKTAAFPEVENLLLAEHKLFPQVEIYALMDSHPVPATWNQLSLSVVRVAGNSATYENESHDSVAQKLLSQDDLEEFRLRLSQGGVDDLPAATRFINSDHPTEYEYVHLVGNTARRVFIRNGGPDGYTVLLNAFRELSRPSTAASLPPSP